MSEQEMTFTRSAACPSVVVVGLASCFGCQVQITNAEKYLLEILGQIDLKYWQLASSDPHPEHFDVAVIEGAVTTEESVKTIKELREKAAAVITVGACACTGGIPGMASKDFFGRQQAVYGDNTPTACGTMIEPRPVADYIKVDYEVPCCPIDPYYFVTVLQRALYGSNKSAHTATLCGECKQNERGCFYMSGTMCMGMITRKGCGAKCTNLGRPCMGCSGLAPDANVPAARMACERFGIDPAEFDKGLEVFNQSAHLAPVEQ